MSTYQPTDHPAVTAHRADAMTEEAPRDPATLTADALATLDRMTIHTGAPSGAARGSNVERLARIVAELAQHVARLDAAVDALSIPPAEMDEGEDDGMSDDAWDEAPSLGGNRRPGEWGGR